MKKRPANWKHPIPKDAILPHKSVPHDPIDDYDLPPHIDFDYENAIQNPYAGRVQFTHGGARKGAGRKPSSEPAERHTVTLYKKDLQALRKLDVNLSRAIRKLIAAKGK
ncbi:MAG TPA: hypothetical protein VFD70_06220 [Anaerolineae bacterium]|nr:hypothetical protein [Anaerolineae bacterium]